jgi:hypothetical protein
VLIEAGHRCAIHSCRHVDVDVHHIVPWAQCGEHRFENLIALCPNCHRRAERGDIDRKSLRLYKARLVAAFRFEEVNLYPDESVLPAVFGWIDPSGQWATKTIAKALKQIEIGFDYPQFSKRTLGGATADINRYIKGYIDDLIRGHVDEMAGLEPSGSSTGWFLQASFSVSLIRASVISLRFTMTSFSGGAHGAHWTEVQNLATTPLRHLSIEDLFTDSDAGIRVLSDYAIGKLLEPGAPDWVRDEQWVREGAGPDPKNFKAFNLTSRGILLTFDEYQVGSYAEGTREIHVPYDVVTGLLQPTLAVNIFGHEI